MTESVIKEMLAKIDVQINGSRPWDIQIHNHRLWGRVIRQGSLGLGEAYMEGWWDCQALDQLFYRIMRGDLEKHFRLTLPVLLGIAAYACVICKAWPAPAWWPEGIMTLTTTCLKPCSTHSCSIAAVIGNTPTAWSGPSRIKWS